MAENPKQRFRRVLNDLSQDDRTFLDSGLRRIYSESLSYGLKNNFLTKDEVVKYQTLAQQRDTALRKVNVLDPQGNPISKETTVPVMRNGQVVQEKRVTPVTPFDLLRKTGGQMEGGSVDGPLFTGYTLDTGAPIGTARKKFQEEVIPAAQKAATELEKTKGQTKFYQPGTAVGLLAGGLASIPVGIGKAVTAPLAAGVSRGIGLVDPEASRQFDESVARAYYPEATVDVSQPFKTGVDVGQIAGIKAAEAIPASLAALTAGGAAAIPASIATTPVGGAVVGTGVGLAAAAATNQAQNFLTELALGSSYKPAAEGLGFDIQRSPLSEARARFTQERTELAPSAAFAGEFAPNLLMGTPTLPKGFFGGAKAGLAATRLGQEGRAALTAASMPAAESLAGKFAATPVMQAARNVGQRLERIPGVGATATFGRGFAQSEPGREFLSDIAERGVEGSADLYFALKENADKPADQRDPMWMILGKTALGSMFEGQHRLGAKLNAPGQALGMAAVRKLDERMGTFTPEAYTSLTPPVVPSATGTTPTGATATPRVPSPFTFGKTRVTGASTPLPTLDEGVVPIGGGMVARIAPTGEATVESAPPVDYDRTPASSPSVGRNVLDALGGVAPKSNLLSVGNIGRVGTRFGTVQSQGGESQLFLGLTHDGLVMVKATDKKTGESSIDLVSPDLLIGDNKRIAREAFKAGNLTPSDKTGYQRKDYDVELSRTADYEPTSEGEGPSSKDFDKEIRVSKNPIFGRVVKAIDENFSVMQIPSPVGGFDMMVVPNDTVTGLKRGQRAVAGEVLDTTSMNLDMSAYRVDRGKYDPIFKGDSKQRITGATHPIMLTPEQVADAAARKTNLGNFRNQLKAEGRAEGDVNAQYNAARDKSYADLRKATPKAENDYAVGSTIDFTAADGEVSKGVVVGNTAYGPTVVDVANPMSPAFTVQEPQIVSSSAEPTVKPEPEKKTTTKPKAEKKEPAKKEPVKKAEPKAETKPEAPKVEEKKAEPVKAETPKVEPKVEPAKSEPAKTEAPKPVTETKPEVVKVEVKPEVKPEPPKVETKPEPAKTEVTVTPAVVTPTTPTVERVIPTTLSSGFRTKVSNVDVSATNMERLDGQRRLAIAYAERDPTPEKIARRDSLIADYDRAVNTFLLDVKKALVDASRLKNDALTKLSEDIRDGNNDAVAKRRDYIKLIDDAVKGIEDKFNSNKSPMSRIGGKSVILDNLTKQFDAIKNAVIPEAPTVEAPRVEVAPTPKVEPEVPKSIVKPTTEFTPEEQKVINDVESEVNAKTQYWERVLDKIKGWDTFSDAAKRKIKELVDNSGAELVIPKINDSYSRSIMRFETPFVAFIPRVAKVLRPGIIAPDGSKFKAIVELVFEEPIVKPEVPKAEVAPTPTVAVEPEKVEAPMPSGVPVSGYGVANPKEVAELIGEKRFELGKKLTAEQRKKILGKVGDSYVDQRHQKEFAGVDNRGEEMYKYPYSTGHMYVSNITGKFIRYYVVIPADITEGLIGVKRDIFAHPSELFPDISSGKAVELARTQRSSQLRQLLINANELQLITDDEFSKAINLLPRYVEEKLKENSTKVIEDILTKAEAYNTPSQEVETLAKAIRDNASAGIPDFISQSLRDSLMGDELSKKIAYKALNGIPFDKNWNGAVIAGKARVKREAQAPTVEPEKVEVPEEPKPVVKPTISSADLIGESDITPSDEGSALNVTLPGDVQVLDDDGSLVRVQASIEGLEDINDVFRKARNVDELRDVLRGVIRDAGILKSPADIDAAADKLSKYYDEWLRAFVNRDLLIAQQYAQGIRKFASDETSGSQTRYGIDEEEITAEDTPQAAKQKRIRNRVARLYQAYDMPRIGQVVDLLNSEASKKFVKNVDGEFVYDTSKTFFDLPPKSDIKLNVVRDVQAMMLRERYRTNMPVFSVMSKAPQISEAFDKAFVGEGAYVNIKGKDNNIGQQVVFITTNQADVSTIVEELSHAILENMPIDMARQVATKLDKTLREPTTTNESVASYELQEMFAARMRLSFITGEDAFTSVTGSTASRKRISGLWDGIRNFLKDTYKALATDITEIKGLDGKAVVTQWSVPYNPETISLWDKAPILFTDDDGKTKWGQIESTKKYPFGPGMVSAKNLEKPIVTIKTRDNVIKDIKPVQILAISDAMDKTFAKEFGHMLLKFLSGSNGPKGTSIAGLRDSYVEVTKAIKSNSYEGLVSRVDEFVDDVLFNYRLKAASDNPVDKTASEGLLRSLIPNKLLALVNQANRYGVLSDVDSDPKSALSLKNWLNAIGTLRAGEGLNEKSAFAKFYKKDAEFWVQSNIKKLQTAIRDAKEYAGALEGKGLFDDDAYHIDAGNTGGNLLYSSRQIGDSSEKNRALADGQASTLNPDAVTPVDFAMTATQQGMPREVVTPVVQERVIADAERNGLANSNIRLLEINDVLVIDGTVNISDTGIDTISKAIDFAARNNIQNTILVTKAAPNEELGYNASKGYSVEPSVTFQFEDPIADNVYAFIKRMHPYVRKSIDGQSLTIHNIEQKGKSYEESLNVFEQATSRIAKELAKRRIPVQAIQDTERVWNFGNESAQGYAVPYYEARNLLHLINPQVLETGQRPVSDPRIKDVLQTALSTVAGRNIKLPDIDFSSVPDNHERRLAMGSNYDKLPTNSYDTNPETKEAYDSLMSELDRQYSYLNLSSKEIGSDGVAKYTLPDVVSTKHPLMQDSKHKDVDGNPLRYIDLLNAIHDSISDSVKLASGGEHSDLMAFAAHSAITKDPKAIRALYTETLGRKVYEQLSGKDVHKAALPTVEDAKTGIVALDKRVQALYAETKSPYGDLKKNEVTNGMGRVQYASGSGTPLYSLRPIRDVDVSDTGEPEVASEENPVVVVDDAGTEVTVTEESKISKVLDFLDKNPVTKTFDVLNALGRFTMAGDWSAPLVQNWQLANPIESPGLFFKSLLFGPKSLAPNLAIDTGKGGINKNAFFGRKQVHAMGDEIRANRFYELAKEMKLSLATIEYDRILAEKRAEREEKLAEMRKTNPDATLPEIDIMDIDELDVDPDMMGLLSAERHVPGKAASERAMTMMKDFVKFNKFTQALETYEQLGYDPSSEGFKEMAQDMAAVLNVMNGDVRFTKNEYDKSIGRLMRRVMFAPRWLTSRVMADPIGRLILAQGETGRKWLKANNLPTERTINPYVLRANYRMVLKAQALWYALLAYFGLMRPFDQFQVKTSVDHMFTRIQVGNYVFKAPGGSMMLLEIADGLLGGKIENLPPDEARKRFAERMETLVMGRFINSPGIGIMKEMFTGRDFMGKPVGYVDPDLEAYWQKVVKPTMAEVGVPVPDMKLSKLVTKNLQYLWLQSYLETFKLADDREEDDKMFEAAFVGGMSALGGRIRYNPPAGKGAYDYDTYGNPPGLQYYILGANREEWLMNPASDLTQEQLDAMEKDVVE